MMSVVYKRSLYAVTKNQNDVRSWPSYNVFVNILLKALIFPVIGKKNNQSSVSNAV